MNRIFSSVSKLGHFKNINSSTYDYADSEAKKQVHDDDDNDDGQFIKSSEQGRPTHPNHSEEQWKVPAKKLTNFNST
jgi:hypothetical protein